MGFSGTTVAVLKTPLLNEERSLIGSSRRGLDDDKPASDDRTLGTTPTSALLCRRAGRRGRSGAALGLEEIHQVRLRIYGDGLRAWERVHTRDDGVLIGGILVNDRDVALTAVRNVNQFPSRI